MLGPVGLTGALVSTASGCKDGVILPAQRY